MSAHPYRILTITESKLLNDELTKRVEAVYVNKSASMMTKWLHACYKLGGFLFVFIAKCFCSVSV